MDSNEFENVSAESGVVFEPEPSILEGGWLGMVVTRFWFQEETRKGDTARKGGMTFEHAFGHEVTVVLPLTDDPDESKVPENCITIKQLKIALNSAMSVIKGE